jgi:hypothetical protein
VPPHIEQPPLPSEPLSSCRGAEPTPEQNRARLPGVVAFARFSFRLAGAAVVWTSAVLGPMRLSGAEHGRPAAGRAIAIAWKAKCDGYALSCVPPPLCVNRHP